MIQNTNLKDIFDNVFKGATTPVFDTVEGPMYLEPKGEDKIVIGYATNAGVVPKFEFEYDFSQSFEWNIQGMIEQVLEKVEYPVE